MKLVFLFIPLISTKSFDYKANGANWPSLSTIPKNNCDGGLLKNQSPIDLLNGWEKVDAKEDNFQRIYSD